MTRICDPVFWEKDKSFVKCHLCPHDCKIVEGKFGKCKVRKNTNGNLVLNNYGQVVAKFIDSLKKRPIIHYFGSDKSLSIGLSGCSATCPFCQNYEISQKNNSYSSYHSAKDIIEIAEMCDVDFISFTYTEPIVWIEYIKDIIKELKDKKIKVCLKTAGNINKQHVDYILDDIDILNIDLKPQNENFLEKSNIFNENAVYFFERALKRKIHVEISHIIIPNINNNEQKMKKLFEIIEPNIDIPVHLLKHIPIFQSGLKETSEMDLLFCKNTLRSLGLKNIYIGE